MSFSSVAASIKKTVVRLDLKEGALATQEGLSVRWQIVVFLVSALAIFSHCPSDFTHAQFFAEDGFVWYADAYNLGWLHSLLLPHVGYLSVAERLGTGLSLLAPFQWAPVVMVTIGLLFQWLPVAVLVSPRCRNWAPLTARIFFAALYLALPNNRDIHVVLTNCMWHLGLVSTMLAFGCPPRSWLGRCFDIFTLSLSSISGPFGILLTALLMVYWWIQRQSWSLVQWALLAVGDAMQLYMLHYHGIAHKSVLGATPQLFIRMLGGDVFTGMMFGSFAFGAHFPLVVHLVPFIAGLAILLYCTRQAGMGLRFFVVYGFLLLPSSLGRQIGVDPLPLWQMLLPAASIRYWFFPGLAFIWSAGWCALYAKSRAFRLLGTLVMLAVPIGIAIDWIYPPFPDANFALSVQRLEQAAPGEHVVLPIVPVPMTMELVKKSH